MMIAALYVDVERGPYGPLGCDLWGVERDAREYAGPWPVVAHPPCQRWGNFWWSDGSSEPGHDGGCFAAAVDAVNRYGGVLEHPRSSRAWAAFGLRKPKGYGWAPAGPRRWVGHVDQACYGHPCRKPTWLYYVGGERPEDILPARKFDGEIKVWVASGPGGITSEERAAKGIKLLSKRDSHITPRNFAIALVALAGGGMDPMIGTSTALVGGCRSGDR